MDVPDITPVRPDRDYRIFYLLMTFVIAGVYVSTLVENPSLHEPWRLAVYSVLLVLHVAIHWFLEKLTAPKQITVYVILQGALAFAVVFLSNSIQMVFGLFVPLMGEIAGLLGLNRKTLLAICFYIALSALAFFLVTDRLVAGWWLLMVIPAAFFSILYTMMYIRQSQARERAQILLVELEKANRQLREYAAQVEDLTIVAERQRMARELHDTLSQGLAGLILQLEAVDAHLVGNRTERARLIVWQTMEKARGTLAEARQAIDNLRQTHPLDLGEAARQEVEHFTSSTDIPCSAEINLPAKLSDSVTETAIRSISEGLTNVARHAQARNVSLRVANGTAKGELEIEIRDDGIGFDPISVEAGHYGLLGMRERVRLAGGSLEIHSSQGQGTQLVVRFPLETEAPTAIEKV